MAGTNNKNDKLFFMIMIPANIILLLVVLLGVTKWQMFQFF